MNILDNLAYESFHDFYIRVEKIKHGWMDLYLAANGKEYRYEASYLSDPLNDLLAATVAMLQQTSTQISNDEITFRNGYLYVIHECEPGLVTWLIRYVDGNMMLIIWEEIPADLDELIEQDFESNSGLADIPDLTKYLVFALKGPPKQFVKSMIDTFVSLENLERHDDEWGFSYSIDNLHILMEWQKKNDIST